MKRATAVLVTVGFALAACGGGDDDSTEPAEETVVDEPAAEEPDADEPAAGEPDDTTENTTDDTGDATTEDTTDDTGDATTEDTTEDTGDDTTEDVAGNDDTSDDTSDNTSDDDGGGISISSLDDIPQECQDLMAGFLRDLEPIVSTVDWSQATLSDFEGVAGDFESQASQFDAASADAGCDDLDFVDDDDGFGLIIEFADDVAPGTIPFFEFLDSMMGGTVPTGDGEDASGGAIETCDDAIGAIEALMDGYDGLSSVPVSEMAVLSDMATVMMSCSPDQFEFFESDAVNDFLSR